MWVRRVGGSVSGLAYGPDARTLFVAEGERVTAWDIAARAHTHRFRINLHPDALHVVDRFLFVSTYPQPFSWNLLGTEDPVQVPGDGWGGFLRPAPTGPVVHFIPRPWNVIRACDLETQKTSTLVARPEGAGDMMYFACAPDMRTVIMGSHLTWCVRTTLETGVSVPMERPSNRWVYDVRFAADGSLVWVFDTGVQSSGPEPGARGAFVTSSRTGSVFALHPTAPVFAAYDAHDRLTLFHLHTGEVIRTFDLDLGRWINCIKFSPDGLTCAVGGTHKQFAVFDVDL